MSELSESFWSIAREYARQFGEIIGHGSEFWVADAPSVCCFGDMYFTLEEMRATVDNLPKYVERYGSIEAVGQEVRDWVNWWLDGVLPCQDMERTLARVTFQLRPNINLDAWLDGCPRIDREPWSGPDADFLRLCNDRDTLSRLIDEYRGARSLDNVLTSVVTKLETERKKKELRDAEERARILKDWAVDIQKIG